jgi:hypothetical protein
MPRMSEREKLRQECHEDLAALRNDPTMSERAYRLLEKFAARLDRLETGEFPPEETPTEPERRPSGAKWNKDAVLKALEEGKKKKEE